MPTTSRVDGAPTEATGPAVWRGTDLTEDPSHAGFERAWSPAELDAFDALVAAIRRHEGGTDLGRLVVDELPLGVLEEEVGRLRHRLVDGCGVQIYTGLDPSRYGEQEQRALWWAWTSRVGTPRPQSRRGDVIGDVRDRGTGISGRTGRGYTSNSELNFHADAADVSGLFYLRTARHGGINRLASSATVHNELLRRRPDLLAELYRPLPWSWQGNEAPGSPPYYEMAVFGRAGEDVACAFVRTNIVLAARNAGAPELTPQQSEAVELLAALAAEPGMWIERQFEPGTMLFVNNHTVLHMRTHFTDWDEPERRRHLLRSWLSLPTSRALPESFAVFFGDTRAGAIRGGYPTSAAPVFGTV
jgi:hypothetical protein